MLDETASLRPATRVLEPVRLMPDLGSAARWTFWSAVLVAAGVWFVVDSFGHPFAWVTLVGAVVILGWFLLQLVLPSWFQITFDPDVLWVRQGWRRFSVEWDDVYIVHIRHVLGDPILEVQLQTRDAVEPGDRTFVPLPVGADVRPVHRFLAARLGHGALPAVKLEPLDL